MANKKISELESRASLSLSDLMAVGDPSTGYLYKTTISDLKTLTGAGVVSFNGRFGTVNPAEGDYTLTQLGDVIITSPSNGQVLKYNGSNWVNATEAGETDTLDTVTGRGNTTANSITVGSVTAAGLSNLLGQIRTFATTGNTYIGASPVSATDAGFKLDVFGSTRVDSLTVRSQTYPTYVLTISHLGVGRQRILGGYGNEWIEFGEGGNTLSLKANEIYYQSTNNSFSANAKILSAGLGGLTFEPTNFYQQGDTRYGFQFTGNYTAAIASSPSVLGLVRFNPSIGTSIGTIDGSILHITPTINTTGGTTNWSAILYSPTITGSTGLDHFFINAASGKVKLGDLGGSGSRMVVADANGVLTTQAIPTGSVTSVFGRTGAVVAASGDYTTSQVTEGTNLYYTDARARAAITLTTTGSSGAATYSGGTLNIPTYTLAGLGGQPALSGTGFVKISGTTISYDNSSYVTLDTTQTITALKTFTNVVTFNQNIVGGLIKLSQGVLLSKSANIGSDPGFLSLIATSSTGLNTINIADGDNTSFTQKLIVPNGGNYNYTFPTSSGTLALVSQIPSLSNYVTLDGTQTITGTKTFGDIVRNTSGGFWTASSLGFLLRNDANSSNLGGLSRRSYWAGGVALDTQIFAESGYGIFLNVNGSTTSGLSLASTGAATFSSSVTASGYSYFGGLRLNGADNGATIWKDSGDMSIYPQNGKLYLGGQGTSNVVTVQSTGVGIGTTNPQSWATLQVNGTAGLQTEASQQLHIAAPTTTVGQGAGIRLNAASGAKEAVGILGIVNEASGNLGAMTFHVYNGGANVPERMRISSAGQVLIGISSTPETSRLFIKQAQDVDYRGVMVESAAAGGFIGSMSIDASGNLSFAQSYTGGSGSYKDIRFVTSNVERLRILSNGNVGINTTNPSSNLEVFCGTGSVFRAVSNGTNIVEIGNYKPSPAAGYQQLDITSSIITLNTGTAGGGSATERLRITSTGLATFTGDVRVKTLEVTNVGTDATSSGVSTYMRITVNGQNYLIPLHGTP